MPFNDAGGFHVNRILVAEIAVADTFRGAVEAKTRRKHVLVWFHNNTDIVA